VDGKERLGCVFVFDNFFFGSVFSAHHHLDRFQLLQVSTYHLPSIYYYHTYYLVS
jgi:hypothetical protein